MQMNDLKTFFYHIVWIVQPTPGRLAIFDVKLFSTAPVTALFNTVTTCSCISFPLYSQISDKAQIVEMQLLVGQADGMSLCPKGIVKVTLAINDKQFEHTFIMCQNLKQPLLLGMDFAQNYRIGIDWNHNSVSYLKQRGWKLISAWPYGSISDPNFMMRETSHILLT